MLSGFLSSSGIDLSYIFLSGTTTTNSGYKLANGSDLSTIFASNASGVFAPNTGYLIIDNRDISRLYEPILTSVSIVNYNFISPAVADYTTVTTATLTGWTTINVYTYVGYGNAGLLNKVTLPSPYTQFCAIQYYQSATTSDPGISQNIQISKLNCRLSFWIIGRNTGTSNTLFSSATQVQVMIDTTQIYKNTLSQPLIWTNIVQNFTVATVGTKLLKFTNLTTDSANSSFLITGIIITYI